MSQNKDRRISVEEEESKESYMIKGSVIKQRDTITRPDVNYRALGALNASMIKLFDNHPVKFFEKFKLGKITPEDKTVSTTIGDLVDFYILECRGDEAIFNNRFDEKFVLFEGKKGTGQAFILADEVFKLAQESVNENGEITREFGSMFTEAFAKVQAMGKYSGKTEDKALEDFNDKALDYYQSLKDNIGKCVVEVSLLDKAMAIGNLMLSDVFTASTFTEEDEHVEMFPKFPIEWTYTTDDGTKVSCKSELDNLRIDHAKKYIYLHDLKTTYDNESFEYSYIKYGYYIQAAFYYLAVQYWAKEEGMEDYTIVPMEFIVGDTSGNNRRPIKYQCTEKDLHAGLYGFTLRGVYHKGVKELIEEIIWAEGNNVWNASKTVVESKGRLSLNLNYD